MTNAPLLAREYPECLAYLVIDNGSRRRLDSSNNPFRGKYFVTNQVLMIDIEWRWSGEVGKN